MNAGCRLALACAILCLAVQAIGSPVQMEAGRFGKVTVYKPAAAEPQSVALFVSGDGGWNLGVLNMAQSLADIGALVVGIDIRRYLAALAHSHAACTSLGGDFEQLSHQVQKQLGLKEYHVPVLVGYSSGATVVYATLVQAPAGTFAGAISLGFCPDQDFAGAKLCPVAALQYTLGKKGELIFEPAQHLEHPWIALQGQKDAVCAAPAVDEFAARTANAQVIKLPLVGHGFSVERNWLPQFKTAYQKIATPAQPAATLAPEIRDLPVIEMPGNADSDTLAILLTGDGGWTGLDRELAARLAARGVGAVGLNSLRYFWHARSPDEVTRDVTRILRHYLVDWKKTRFILVGYSFGADVAPFVANGLPADLRAQLAAIALLGLEARADFEVRVVDWIPGADEGGQPVSPQLAMLQNVPVLCIYGESETDSLCPSLKLRNLTSVRVSGGHHFGGDYTGLADRILSFSTVAPDTGPR